MAAIRTFKEIALMSAIIYGLLIIFVYSHFEEILSVLTKTDSIKNLSFSLRAWLVINIPTDCFAYVIRGVIKALGMQQSILMAHLIGQGILGSFLTFLFGFYFDLGLNGVWLAKTCMTYFLITYYLVILYRLDWFEIVLEAHKR